jgi:hypothetical protein
MIAGTGSGLDLVPVFAGRADNRRPLWVARSLVPVSQEGTGVKVFPVKIICVKNGNLMALHSLLTEGGKRAYRYNPCFVLKTKILKDFIGLPFAHQINQRNACKIPQCKGRSIK